MKTYDGKSVKEDDKVWVLGSCGTINKARVLEPVTSYHLFGPIPVSMSFSTKKAAQQYLKDKYAKRK